MKKYGLVFKLAAEELFEYRFDFLASTTKYALMVVMISLVWLAVGKTTDNLPLTNQQLVQYFFFSAMLFSLVNYHTTYIEEDIRLGSLNKFLLKPISAFWYYLSYESASVVIQTVLKMLVMIPLLWWLGFGFSVEVGRVALFSLFIPFIYLFSFTFYSLLSGLAFWITEAQALRWGCSILFRFLAGTLLPISFLPHYMQAIMFWMPFQHVTYTPILLIQTKIDYQTAFASLAILIGWTLFLQLLRMWQWQAGYKEFEGSGV